MANVNGPDDLAKLPAGTQGIAMDLMGCGGVTDDFKRKALAYKGNSRLHSIYIMDEPTPASCNPETLSEMTSWIHTNVGAKTFVVLHEWAKPYAAYAGNNDYVGMDPYPCEENFCDYNYIPKVVNAAIADGIDRSRIVPTYQVYSKPGESEISIVDHSKQLAEWAKLTPNPPFDFAWSWEQYDASKTMRDDPASQAFFAARNANCTGVTAATPQPPVSPQPIPNARSKRAGEFKTRDVEFLASLDRLNRAGKTSDPRYADTEERHKDMQARWSAFRGQFAPTPAIECDGSTRAQEQAFTAAAIADGISRRTAENFDFSCPDAGGGIIPANSDVEEDPRPPVVTEDDPTPLIPSSGPTELATGNPTLDRFDDLFAAASAKHGFPDAGYVKSIAWWESNQKLDPNAVSDDSPCGGSGLESKSIGIFQVTRGCGEASEYTVQQLMDPAINIDIGVKHLTSIYQDMQRAHPGCTQRQYLDMTGAGWVQNYGTITGCGEYTDQRQTSYVNTVGGKYDEWYGGGAS